MAEETPVKAKEEKKTEAAPRASSRAPRNERGRGGRSSRKRREPRERSEFDQKIISIRRVTRVVAGGRRFSFSVAIVIGDRKGQVGVGIGKAGDTALAIDKAVRDAKKNLAKLKLTKEKSVPHEVSAKYSASSINLYPAPGKGLIAGSSVRTVLELGGVRDVSGRVMSRSKNHLNNARATIEALGKVRL
ncbi:MAG: 30S ribosomal protein S5 [Candidatus Paceibacterota bacterium]